MKAIVEDVPAPGQQISEKAKLLTCRGARRDYLTFLGQDRNHLRALAWLDMDKEKKPPGKSDSGTCSEEP